MLIRLVAPVLILFAASSATAQFATTEVSPPGSPEPFRITKPLWTWENIPAVTYSVYRSDAVPAGFTCILDRHPTSNWTGDQDPFSPSRRFYYLVTAYDGTDDNRPGNRSDGTARTLDTPCPRDRACCLTDGSCLDLEPGACLAQGGTPGADQSTCLTTPCTVPCASGTPVAGRVPLRLVPIGNFTAPIFLTSPPGDTGRIFVGERAGTIQIQRDDGSRPAGKFLDISAVTRTGSERGLLGFAFHPDYATNGLFYVYYSTASTLSCGGDHCARISEFTVSADPDVAVRASERIILELGQPFGNHNGGWIGFGPDGFLYIAFGDGGSANDPLNAGQDLNTLLGKILRMDVDGRDPGLAYAIPPSNPFVGVAGTRGEIWSWGLRNPWRNSFDRATGDLYIADVGQGRIEEVDVAPAASGGGSGVNYGWRVMEGSLCFNPPAGCDMTGKALPDHEYNHSAGDCSITGGYVYRGCRMPDWQGSYFFADYCGEWIDTFEYVGGVATNVQRRFPTGATNGPVSFGEDASGEIYVLEQGSTVYRIEP